MIRSQNDDELSAWLERAMATNSLTPSINMKFFSAYAPKVGIRFSVERLHNLQQKLPCVVISSIGPPAMMYGPTPRRTPDVSLSYDVKHETAWSSLQFTEEPLSYSGLPMTIKLGFILDVKQFKQATDGSLDLVDLGWSFLAIYNSLENEDGSQSLYVNSGLF